MKRVSIPILTGVLALSVAAPFSVFAAANSDTVAGDGVQQQVAGVPWGAKAVHKVNREQLLELVNTYAPDLADDFTEVFAQLQPTLDEETKQKVEQIRQQLKDGAITQEEAEAQLAELGIEHPGFLKVLDRPQLDEETKQKVEQIRQQLKDGAITQEEAKAQLAELGVPFRLWDEQHQLWEQLQQAVEANDSEQIRTLLEQLLTVLQNRVEAKAE